MTDLDFNLLIALDALLREKSVSGAGKRLNLSTSAMSRALTRLRAALHDPILVQAGRAMVPTAHAMAIAADVHALKQAVTIVLGPAEKVDVSRVRRDFTIRANEAFVLLYASTLNDLVKNAAPGIRLRFAPKSDRELTSLRDASIDLDIGLIVDETSELRCQRLFDDRYVGVVRKGHPLLGRERISLEAYTSSSHVVFSPQADFEGPVDFALRALGTSRDAALIVPSFPAVIAVAATTDLVGTIPESYCKSIPTIETETFELPFAMDALYIMQSWHPRVDAEPVHRWMRGLIHETFKSVA